MNRSKKALSIFMFLIALALTGCNDELYKGEQASEAIRFNCDSVATRASGYETAGTNPILSMGVYSAYTAGDWSGTAKCDFMQNLNVSRANVNSPWTYGQEMLWPGSGKLSFFAYAPNGALGSSITDITGAPKIRYEVQVEQQNQVDFLIATPKKNQAKTSSSDGYTSMILRHALTRIYFAAKLKDEVTENVVITNIELAGVYKAGSTTMDGTNRVWTPETAKATYLLTSANGGLKAAESLDNNEYKTVTPDNGALFLLPQTIPSDATIKVTFTIDGVAEPAVEIALADALAQWQAGESIRFLINIDANSPQEIELTYQFTAWSTALTTDVPIAEDPYLYVSDIEVKAYDGATTRVYFYTNQAAPFIDPIGRLVSTNGVTTRVKHHFYNLVKDPSTVSYPQNVIVRKEEDYGGSTNVIYDATTKKGYFDVVNRIFKGTSTGDKTAVVIRLRAGKLDKYITITPHITPYIASKTGENNSPTTPRYLSIYHRRSEKGERILAWYEPDNLKWTIEVDKTVGDWQDVIIDRLPSVDHHTNLLYTSNPRDPEGGAVDPGWGTTFSGRGRVHLRMGWKTPANGKNRYAHIKYIITPDNGSARPAEIIRCRQGEEADFLVGTTGDKFAVYNLMGDGTFTQYPSQGGFISQWGRPRMWPLVGTDAPSGYPIGQMNTELDPDVAICPEGYGYPTKATIGDYFQNTWGGANRTIAKNCICADGFYDRRTTVSDRVDPSSINIAAAGLVIFASNDPGNCKSIFLPSPGYRNETGLLGGVGVRTQGVMNGTLGGYWSGEEMTDKNRAYGFHANAAGTVFTQTRDIIGPITPPVDGYDKRNSFMVRCIKIENAIKLIFDANGGENAPRATTASPNSNVYVTRKIPINYWRQGYFFVGWNTDKNSTTASVYPGSQYTMGTTNATLYAIWSEFFKVNLANTMLVADQAIYTTKNSYTALSTASNGTKIPAATVGIEAIAKLESAHYSLEFDKEIKDADTWVNAYDYCKGKGGAWRLPRITELLLFSQKSIIPAWAQSDLFGGVSSPLWCGSEQDGSMAYEVMYFNSRAIGKQKTDTQKYRCVREVTP